VWRWGLPLRPCERCRVFVVLRCGRTRRNSRSIPFWPKPLPNTGCSARWAVSLSIRTITSGCCSVRVSLTETSAAPP